MNKTGIVTFVLLFCFSTALWAEYPQYTVKRIAGKITIDGKLDEADWNKAQSFGDFKFPWWKEGEKEQTEVKMLWDDKFLYVSFKCQDKHIWADHYDVNAPTCLDDCAEIFWNPNPEKSLSFNQFEINCIGNVMCGYYDFGNPKAVGHTIMVPHIGQTIQGTVNNDQDIDSGWVVETAIRFSDYPELSPKTNPQAGDVWRIGLHRCGGKTNEQYSQWSPSQTPAPNFHRPQDFGRIVFSAEKVK
ncbi:MAG: carbohydrate-binding family 9-like protein [Candidatus Latescibacterota bacterium]